MKALAGVDVLLRLLEKMDLSFEQVLILILVMAIVGIIRVLLRPSKRPKSKR